MDEKPKQAARPAQNPFGGELLEVGARASRPQSLIISVYGSYVRDFDNWFPVSVVVQLMQDLDVDEISTRNALSRLKRRKIFVSEVRGDQAGYGFTPNALAACIANDEGIYGRRLPPVDSGWVLVAFSIPEKSRSLRYQLKAQLARLGLAQVEAALVIGPAHLKPQVIDVVRHLKLENRVRVFEGRYEAFDSIEEAVSEWWDLDAIASTYQTFIEMYSPMERAALDPDMPADPRSAFIDYMRLMTSWRTLPVFDPGLPPNLLPEDWPGFDASRLFYSIHDAIAKNAFEHVAAVNSRMMGS